jgi:hypothetical protein
MTKAKVLFLLCFLVFTTPARSQRTFEKGYFISAKGERTEALLRNTNLGHNPEQLEYKLTPEGGEVKIPVAALKEFAVYNQWKYIVAEVDFDRVETDLTKLGAIRNPEFKREILPLKVMVEGKASLYAYFLNRATLFFFNVDGGEIRQLVWKPYKSRQLEISYNNFYQQQLWTEVRCNVTEAGVARLDYKLQSLEKYFLDYNACTGTEVQHQDKRKKGKISLALVAGMGFSQLEIQEVDGGPRPEAIFRDNFVIQAGLQAEFLFPFNNNRTGLLFNPVYQSFSARGDEPFEEEVTEYNSLLLSVGLRQYFFLTDESKLFLNAIGSFDVPMSETIGFLDVKPRTTFGVALGAGFMYQQLGIEARYHFQQDIIDPRYPLIGHFSKGVVVLSYKIW